YHNREQLNPDAPLDKQLYVICRNLILNNLKRQQKVIPLNGNIPEPSYQDSSDEEDYQIKQELFHKWVGELPEQQQKVYTLHKLDRYSYSAIRQVTLLSDDTIGVDSYLATNWIHT